MHIVGAVREEERDPQGSPGSGRSWPGSSRQDLGVKNVGPRDSQTWNQGSSYSSSLSISFFACKMEIRGVPPWRAWEGSSEHVCDMPRARGYVRIPPRVRATGSSSHRHVGPRSVLSSTSPTFTLKAMF